MWARGHGTSGRASPRSRTDGGRQPALREFALKAAPGWHPDFSTMIRMTDPSSIGVITIRTSVPVGPWPSGRITPIGDAIHSMTPSAPGFPAR